MLSKIYKKVKNFFKKEEEGSYPSDFALIKINDVAKEKGLEDEQNKAIVRYINGEISEIMPFNKAFVDALREIDGIPVEEEEFKDEDFEWDSTTTLGVINYKK